MYVSPVSGKYYVFVSSESGQVQQWELFDNGAGKVDARQVRSFAVGSQSEGLVADDVLRHLYVGEEDVGIWKYSAEPDGGPVRTQVDHTGAGGHLAADVEGLTIYYANGGAGYLLASSQGNNEFVVYRRDGNNTYVGNLALVAGGAIDAVTDTDGIDVTNFALGSQFPQGMFVAQDNDDNFKLARWDAIDAAFGGTLIADTNWDPRLVGRAQQPPALPGDYNSSRRVDAADYVVWRKTLGQSVTPFSGADGDGNGRVDVADHGVWGVHLGRTLPSAAAVETATPPLAEPVNAAAAIARPFDGNVSAKISRGARRQATLEIDEGQSNRDMHLSLLLALAGQELRRTNAHSAESAVESESNAMDAAFELHLPVALSVRARPL
jgi:hypothetical protein